MNKYELSKEDVVLLVIDLQEKLMKAMDQKEKVYKNTNLLMAAAYQMDIPLIVSEQYPRGLGSTVDDIKKNLQDYQYIEKKSFSAYIPEMQKILENTGRKTVIVAGSETHICVYQTVRDLIKEGYNVHLVRDAVCSRFKENYLNGLELMREVGAVISTAEAVTFDLLKEAGTSDFKVISPLLK